MNTEEIRTTMAKHRISGRELAKEAKYPESMISMIRTERYVPSVNQLVRIERALKKCVLRKTKRPINK